MPSMSAMVPYTAALALARPACSRQTVWARGRLTAPPPPRHLHTTVWPRHTQRHSYAYTYTRTALCHNSYMVMTSS